MVKVVLTVLADAACQKNIAVKMGFKIGFVSERSRLRCRNNKGLVLRRVTPADTDQRGRAHP
jgi:hypothetical protein